MSRFAIKSAATVIAGKPMKWIVHGVFPERGIATIYGPSGSGKSMLALDLIAAVADGLDWFGLKTLQRRVLYLVLEGQSGLRQRLRAWEVRYQRAFPESVQFLTEDFALNNDKDVSDLCGAMSIAGGFDVVCVDTLAASAPGFQENTSADMSQILVAAGALQKATDGIVILIHHSGKAIQAGMRGHSSLQAAVDAAVEVQRTADERRWRLSKAKDSDDGASYPFKLAVIKIEDEGYEPTSSCVVEPTSLGNQTMSNSNTTPQNLTPNQQVVLEVADQLFVTTEVTSEVLSGEYTPLIQYEAVIDSSRDLMSGGQKHQLLRAKEALDWLIKREFLSAVDGGWLSAGNPSIHQVPANRFIMNNVVECDD